MEKEKKIRKWKYNKFQFFVLFGNANQLLDSFSAGLVVGMLVVVAGVVELETGFKSLEVVEIVVDLPFSVLKTYLKSLQSIYWKIVLYFWGQLH